MAAASGSQHALTDHPLFRRLGAGALLFAAGLALGHRLEFRHTARRRAREIAARSPAAFERLEPGRGRTAANPLEIPRRGWIDIGWRAALAYVGDRIGFLSGGVTFFILLSLAPALSAFVSLYGLFLDPADAWKHLNFLHAVMPPAAAQFIGEEMKRLATERSSQLSVAFAGSLALALWSANAAVKSLFYGLNVAYHEVEKRNFVRYNLICLAFTLGGIAFLIAATALVVVVPLGVHLIGLPVSFEPFAWLRLPALFVVFWLALTLAYRFGPCRADARWRWVSLGAVFATVGSVAVSLAFSWYLTDVADFQRSYGSLGALMGFMLWTYLSIQVVLFGAVVNAEVEHQTAVDSTTGEPLPIGERGALMADTIGPRRGSPRALGYTLKHAEMLSSTAMKQRGRRTPTPIPPN
jgi:membrane protein